MAVGIGTILVTGANGSLAFHAIRYLLLNPTKYSLLLTVRNASGEDPNTEALHKLLDEHKAGSHASVRQLDHTNLALVHDFAHGIATEIANGELPPLVSIVCNAYHWNLCRPMELTPDGFEQSFQVIHLAHVALVLRLLGSFHPHKAGRIVLFSTDAIFPGKNALEKLPPAIPEELDLLAHPPPDRRKDDLAYGFRRYANAKLAVVMWMHALNRRLEKSPKLQHVTAVAVWPGSLSDSRALRTNTPAMIQYLSKIIIRPLRPLITLVDPTVRTSQDAGIDAARLATNEEMQNERGHLVLLQKEDGPPDSLDEQKQEKIWLESARWIGLATQDTTFESLFK